MPVSCLSAIFSASSAIVVDAGVYEDAFEPAFEGGKDVGVAGFFKLMDVLEQLDKAFVHDLFYLFDIILIPVADLHGVVPEHGIQLFLAGAVVCPASDDECVYMCVSGYQF